jgi:hypothetical protein
VEIDLLSSIVSLHPTKKKLNCFPLLFKPKIILI